MALRPIALIALLTSALGAGCLDDDSSGGLAVSDLDDIPDGSAPTGPGAGTAAGHGRYERIESDVTVTRSGEQWTAKKTVTFTNDFGGAANADVKLTTRTGGVRAEAWGEGGYEVVATLQARAATEQQARANLGLLSVSHNDRLGAGRLTLETQVRFPDNTNGLTGGIEASLPAQPAYRITGTTNTGGAQVVGLGGPSVSLDADTGGVGVTGAFNTATLTTDTGGVEMDGVFNVVQATASTGGINARITPTDSGSIDFDSDTGGVSLELKRGAAYGYDVQAEADTGGVSISMGSVDEVGSQSNNSRHVRTEGYDQADIKVEVSASTDTGGVSVTTF